METRIEIANCPCALCYRHMSEFIFVFLNFLKCHKVLKSSFRGSALLGMVLFLEIPTRMVSDN